MKGIISAVSNERKSAANVPYPKTINHFISKQICYFVPKVRYGLDASV